jgi:hypothetical protein
MSEQQPLIRDTDRSPYGTAADEGLRDLSTTTTEVESNQAKYTSLFVGGGESSSSSLPLRGCINGKNADDGTSRSSPNNKKVTYWSLLSENSNFRWFLLSYLVTVAGEWFTYVASIAAIEQINSSNEGVSRTSISILVILRLLPSSLFASIGGVLADSHDRRTMMFILDGIGAIVAWLYVLSYYLKSIVAVFLQQYYR